MNQAKGVRLQGIVKEYVSPNKTVFCAVDNIDIDIQQGEFITLLGPSGCGKTTTLRMIAGFEEPTSGDIFLGNERINSLTPDKRDTAMVFQSYALFPHYNVFNNIAYGLRLKKLSEIEISKKVGKIIAMVGLDGLEERFPNQISGGQQQRVALARALVMEPGVLLFDEPLSNLDAKLRVYMRTEIRKIQRRLGLTSIYVTHDQSEAMSLSDRIIVMNKGIIEQIGTPQEIYRHPTSKFVADFIGRANFFEGTVTAADEGTVTLAALGGTLQLDQRIANPCKCGDKVTVMIRPESVVLGDLGKFSGTIELSTFMGNSQEYIIRIGNDTFIVEQSDPNIETTWEEGDSVQVHLPEKNIHIVSIDS